MDFGINQSLVEELYLRFRENPRSVDGSWQKYFERLSPEEQASLLQTNGAAGARFLINGNNGNGASGNGHAYVAKGSNGAGNGHGAALTAEYPTTATGVSAVNDSDLQKDYQERVTALVNGYRLRGHRFAQLDPLGLDRPENSELSLERFA